MKYIVYFYSKIGGLILLSSKARAISPSPTMAIDAKFKQMKANGEDVVGFGCGEPDFDTPQHIKDAAIRALNNGATKYTPAAGMIELREAVSEKFKNEIAILTDSLAESALTLALAIFITSKVFQTKTLTPDKECEVARSIATLHEMRKDEIEQLRKNSHARVINNIEENDDGGDMANYTFDIPYVETRSEYTSDETISE